MPCCSGGRDTATLIQNHYSPTGFWMGPELTVPLWFTAIVLPVDVGMATAELSAKIPVAVDFECTELPVDTLMLPRRWTCRTPRHQCRTTQCWNHRARTASYDDVAGAGSQRVYVGRRLGAIVDVATMFPDRSTMTSLEFAGLSISARIAEQHPSVVEPSIVSPDPSPRYRRGQTVPPIWLGRIVRRRFLSR